MGERVIVSYKFGDDHLKETLESTTDGRSVEERFDGLVEASEAHLVGGRVERWLWVECDGCGARVEVPMPALPPFWASDERGELCPECAR